MPPVEEAGGRNQTTFFLDWLTEGGLFENRFRPGVEGSVADGKGIFERVRPKGNQAPPHGPDAGAVGYYRILGMGKGRHMVRGFKVEGKLPPVAAFQFRMRGGEGGMVAHSIGL